MRRGFLRAHSATPSVDAEGPSSRCALPTTVVSRSDPRRSGELFGADRWPWRLRPGPPLVERPTQIATHRRSLFAAGRELATCDHAEVIAGGMSWLKPGRRAVWQASGESAAWVRGAIRSANACHTPSVKPGVMEASWLGRDGKTGGAKGVESGLGGGVALDAD